MARFRVVAAIGTGSLISMEVVAERFGKNTNGYF
jgi:hypothetical protein